ncbi:amino acid permease [Gluconacetobacter azotocaptans]|uniref:amino acid permease n=1 Tax=Gluconacetobacter azotocaptans TaxID=142834 RepID=UPI0038D164B6
MAVLTTAATGNAVLVVTSRICFAMARDGLLPGALARVQMSTGVPWAATLLSAGMLGVVALTGSLRLATAIGGCLYVLHFIPSLLVLISLRKRDDILPPFRMPLPTILLPLALGVSGLMLVASGGLGMLGGLIWIGIGACLRWLKPMVRRHL